MGKTSCGYQARQSGSSSTWHGGGRGFEPREVPTWENLPLNDLGIGFSSTGYLFPVNGSSAAV